MKTLAISVLLACSHLLYSQSLFKQVQTVDEFGDVVGATFKNTSQGLFSNTAANDAPLTVHTLREIKEKPDKSFPEFKEELKSQYVNMGFTERKAERDINRLGEQLIVMYNDAHVNVKGTIRFRFLEYETKQAYFSQMSSGTIAIKLSSGEKIKARLANTSFEENFVRLIGYKKITTGPAGVQMMINNNLYDWNITKIYDSLNSATDPVDVVITVGRSTYSFTMKP